MKEKSQDPAITGMDLLGMQRMAGENGDGFTSTFLEIMMHAQVNIAEPRHVVSSDNVQRSFDPHNRAKEAKP